MGRTDVDTLIETMMVACFSPLQQGLGTKKDGRSGLSDSTADAPLLHESANLVAAVVDAPS
jgi:hypothetical protein